MRAGQLEDRNVMVKRGRFPGRSRMAGGAVLTKSASMIVAMTGCAIGRGTLKDVIDMALRAGCADVRAGQLEGRNVMVKRGRFPGRGGMTGGTVLAEGPIMVILMAGCAIGRGALKDVVNMAPRAGCAGVRTGQLEG